MFSLVNQQSFIFSNGAADYTTKREMLTIKHKVISDS